MIFMKKITDEDRIIAAVISAVILVDEVGNSVIPSIGREGGDPWSISHRRMASGKSPLKSFQSARSSRK